MQRQQPNILKPHFENVNFQRDGNNMILNLGPQHPSAHGQLRLVLELDGEKVVKSTPMVGYLHRGMEKMAENIPYNKFLPTTDRMDYIAAASNNYAFAASVESLIGVEVPRRAKVIRTMILEINRLNSHLFWLATHALDVGAMSVFLYCFREREFALDLIESYCGARLTHSAMRIGGVPLDLPIGWLTSLEKYCDHLSTEIDNLEGLLNENRIWKMRLEGVGVMSAEEAISSGCTGPSLRGSGVEYDIRKEEPYELYDELEFDIPVSQRGDAYGRYQVYMKEMRESIKILKQLIPKYAGTSTIIMAESPKYISAPKEQIMTQNYSLMQHFVLVTQGMRPPIGESYVPTESPKGELGFYINSQGEAHPYRLKVRGPSFWHTSIFENLFVGEYLADVITLIGNFNIVLGEVDR
ncbi:MAG: NADH-ubiquinone oxidoreductase chain D (EC [uncultured Campylobacterales bacterium]|uniref:NADH-quinone oxidoreductase subunit D n=1 Tax=uncultured Campylobacterales bacterium TaxID=352960 RepID=A0A6S6SIC6_9BACT|nr:MAG: NADH-ubiquinone oxidoreductase chain D (EC [uncultured Campylobacterales bacterium]